MLKRSVFILSYLVLLCATSCVQKTNIKEEYENLGKLGGVASEERNIIYVDTLKISSSETSLKGHWSIMDNKLCFADGYIVKVIMYDTLGNKLSSFFSRGRGPREFLSPPLSFFPLENGNYFYSDSDQFLYIVSPCPEFEKLTETNLLRAVLPLHNTEDHINNLLKNPDPEDYAMYEICLQSRDFIEYKGSVLFPVTTDHIKFNGYERAFSGNFYKYAYNIMSLDTSNLNINRLFCRYPVVYESKNIPNFKNCHMSTDGKYLYVGFEAEPNIYIYDENFEIIGYFGEPVSEINTDYPETSTYDQSCKLNKTHRMEHGYYSYVSHYGEFLFREYIVPGGAKGIQIYDGHNLVCSQLLKDSDFTVIGYIYPYYYAVMDCNLDNEEYSIVKFLIEK